MKNPTLRNIFFSLIYEITYFISGLIVPRLLLGAFGSEVNGLISSLTGFLGMFTVVEGGMQTVIGAKLYKPLVDGDVKTFNEVVATGKVFYKKIAKLFAIYALGIGILYPLIKQTPFSFSYIFFLVIIMASHHFIMYNTYTILSTIIYSDNKSYISYIAYTIAAIVNILFILIGINAFPSIHFIKFLTFISYLINPILLKFYVNKHYKLDTNSKSNNKLLDQRWDGFAHHISGYVMNNVDIYVLTFFSTLSNISIYSIYSILIASIKQLINTISNIITPIIGRAKASKQNISYSFKLQMYIAGIFTVVIFSCTYVLINPFIRIYTANIQDANYIHPIFAFVFVTSELLACLTFPYIHITYALGDFKNTKYLAYTEMIVNIVLSVILVIKFELVGVIVATLISRIVRVIMQLLYINKNVKDINVRYSIFSTFKYIFMVIFVSILLNYIVVFDKYTFINWVLNGLLALVISTITSILLMLLFENKTTIEIFKSLFHNNRDS